MINYDDINDNQKATDWFNRTSQYMKICGLMRFEDDIDICGVTGKIGVYLDDRDEECEIKIWGDIDKLDINQDIITIRFCNCNVAVCNVSDEIYSINFKSNGRNKIEVLNIAGMKAVRTGSINAIFVQRLNMSIGNKFNFIAHEFKRLQYIFVINKMNVECESNSLFGPVPTRGLEDTTILWLESNLGFEIENESMSHNLAIIKGRVGFHDKWVNLNKPPKAIVEDLYETFINRFKSNVLMDLKFNLKELSVKITDVNMEF